MVYLPPKLALGIPMTDDQFWQLCQNHPDLRFERTAQGELIIMSPTGGITGNRNSGLNYQLYGWNQKTKLGKAFDSSTGFKLPNGADRSPDASWITIDRWDSLTLDQQTRFVPLCPDFVVELRSPSDSLAEVQAKMQEYLENGARLGWLIDPQRQVVEIYRPGQAVEICHAPGSLSGEAVLPGFVLDLAEIL
jgi:Uma2 family endonuclease